MRPLIEKLLHLARYGLERYGPISRKAFLVRGGLTILLFPVILFLAVWAGILGDLPNEEELTVVQNPIASEVYSADSVLLGRYFIQERADIGYEELPGHVIRATLAAEDIRFEDHSGIDLRSLGRVLIRSLLLLDESSGGGSTITQQLAKNLYPRRKYLLFSLPINKIREIIIASRLESVFDKNSILALYLNTIPFGDNTYGLEAAAQRFFSTSAKDLTVDQGAVLVGMLKATHYYNPRLFPERAWRRRNTVLEQMSKYDMLEQDEVDSLRALPIQLNYRKITHHSGLAPYFREHVRSQLLEWCASYNEENDTTINLYTSGLRIYTTIDSRMQRYAEEAMATQMALIQQAFTTHWEDTDPWHDDPSVLTHALEGSSRYRVLLDSGLAHEQIMNELRRPMPMSIFTWKGEKDTIISPVDSTRHGLRFLNTGFIAIDPHGGAIKAWVGGINHAFSEFDHVRESTKRQVGSTFKPIVFASALEQGVRPCGFISAEKTTYQDMEDWTPQNATDNYDLKYSMPGALVLSVNTVAVHVLEKAGIDSTIALAKRMGISSPLARVPALALGAADVSLMEMVTAYACFANGGQRFRPYSIDKVTTDRGELLAQFEPAKGSPVLSEESALLILHMLRRAVNEGTGAALRSTFRLPVDIAGKTGTTQSNADGWFMGITPKLVMGAWVGSDNPAIHFRTTDLGQGARTALPITGDFLQRAVGDKGLDSVTAVRFPDLSASLQRRLSCELYKADNNLVRKLTGREDVKKNFGQRKKSFLKRLFEK